VIYLDASVVLARVLAEDAAPPDAFWQLPLTSSRLLQYEVWNRVHAYGLHASASDDARTLLRHVRFVEMRREILDRALFPFPLPLRTLDSLHLATMDHLRRCSEGVELASYDQRLLAAASALGIEAAPL
jgi:predicted nucleic acid-binding protein